MLLAVAYLMLFFLGIMNITGVTLAEIAVDFSEEVHIIGYFFALISVGCLLALFYSPVLNRLIGIKKLSLISCFILFCGYIGMCCCENYWLYALCMVIIGFGNGFLSFIANYIITNHYTGLERKVKLNRMHFFFSLGAIISPFAASFAISNGIEWEWIYRMLTIVLLVLFYLVMGADFSVLYKTKNKNIFTEDAGENSNCREEINRWSFDVFTLCIGGVFIFYVFAENIFTNWFVLYLNEKVAVDIVTAGASLSLFWFFMTVGRFFSSIIVKKIALSAFILSASLVACVALSLVFFVKNIMVIHLLTVTLGLACSGIYASLLAYGTDGALNPSAELITFYVVCSSLGSILSFFLAGLFRSMVGVSTIIFLGFGAMFSLVVLFIFAISIRRKKILLLKGV